MESGPTGRQWALCAAAAAGILAVSTAGELAGLYGWLAWYLESGLSALRQKGWLYAIAIGYFAPALIALCRRHHNDTPIFILNLLLGWTVLGWIAALIWATTAVRREA